MQSITGVLLKRIILICKELKNYLFAYEIKLVPVGNTTSFRKNSFSVKKQILERTSYLLLLFLLKPLYINDMTQPQNNAVLIFNITET